MPEEEKRAPVGVFQGVVDDKGRMKLPVEFRNFMEPHQAWFSTSLDGEAVRIYRAEEWPEILSELQRVDADIGGKIGFMAARFGIVVEVDPDGRILMPIEWKERQAGQGFSVWMYWNRNHVLVLTEKLWQERTKEMGSFGPTDQAPE